MESVILKVMSQSTQTMEEDYTLNAEVPLPLVTTEIYFFGYRLQSVTKKMPFPK